MPGLVAGLFKISWVKLMPKQCMCFKTLQLITYITNNNPSFVDMILLIPLIGAE